MKNLHALLHLVELNDFLAIALQEVLLRDYNISQSFTRYLETFKWLVKTTDNTLHVEDLINTRNMSYHGVALGIAHQHTESLRELKIDNKNIIGVTLDLGSKKTIVMSLYLPTGGKDQLYEEALDSIASVLEDEADGAAVILMGDLNVDTHSSDRRICAWLNFCGEYDLMDNVIGHITHRHHITGVENELDRFVTRGLDVKNIYLPEDLASSDHSPLIAEIAYEIKNQDEEDRRGGLCEAKVNKEKLEEELEYFQEITNNLAENLRETKEGVDRDSFNAAISSTIFRAAIHCTDQKEFSSQKPRRTRKFKIPKRFYDHVRSAKKAFKNSGKVKGSWAWRDLSNAKKRIRLQMRSQTMEEDRELQLKIIQAANKKSPKVFQLLKKLRQKDDAPSQLPSYIEGYGKTYRKPDVLHGFKELFTVQTRLDKQERYDEDSLNLAKLRVRAERRLIAGGNFEKIAFTRRDFDKILKKLKPDKAQDVFGLSNDLVRMAGHGMKDLIYDFLSECFKENDMSGLLRNFGKGTVIEKKKGLPTTNIKNHRKIVSNNELTVIAQMHVQDSIEQKMRQIQTRFQLGFTEGIPVMSAVIQRLEIAAMSRAAGVPLYLVVLDLKSCFPSISRDHLLSAAADVLSPAEWSLVDQLYTSTYGELRIHSQASEPMFADRGTIEGGILSTQLLKLFLSILLTLFDRAGFTGRVNFDTMEMEPGTVVIADDILGWVWTPSDCQGMLDICVWWSNKCRSEFSIDKSNVVVVGGKPGQKHGPFWLYGKEIEVVELSEHLGVPVTSDSSERAIIEKRKTKTRRAMGSTISFFNPRSELPVFVKIELWRKTYKSVLLFSLETCNMTATQLKGVEDFQLKALRAIFRSHIRAKGVLLRVLAGVPTLWFEIWKLRLGALGGILRGDTIVKDYVLLALLGGVKTTWSYKSVEWLHRKVGEEMDVYDFLLQPKEVFKTGVKALLRGEEFRKMRKEVEVSKVHRVPIEPHKGPLPLLYTDFSYRSQRHARAYAAVYSGDFHRNYSNPCFLCDGEELSLEQKRKITDNTEHLLSGQCRVSGLGSVKDAMADIQLAMFTDWPSHPIVTEVCDITFRSRWLLNPSCDLLGDHKIEPERLQSTGLDIKIREYHYKLLTGRYNLLRKKGISIRRWA